MQKRAFEGRSLALWGAACFAAAAAATAGALMAPSHALAADVVAHSDESGVTTSYTQISDAIAAVNDGKTVVMDADWDLGSGNLTINNGKSAEIDMAGHKITSTNSKAAIYLNTNSNLVLTSSTEDRDFEYVGYDNTKGKWGTFTVTASGLVTNNDGKTGKGDGIYMEDGSSVSLRSIAVAGNSDFSGIYANNNCTVKLDHSSVCHNDVREGGVHLEDRCTLTMHASHIDDNGGGFWGGGVYASAYANIQMLDGSTVSRNTALAGGGFYLYKSGFTITSNDKTGVIADNKSTYAESSSPARGLSGGAFHIDQTSGDNYGVIDGFSITGNYSAYDGGAIELDQESITIKNCIITGNSAAKDGGGIFVYNDDNVIENCIIRDNYCNAGGGDYEGGGIFVSYHYDIKMSGVCVVKGNTRGKDTGNYDDVFLGTVSSNVARAYITGKLSKGSSVGVRTGVTSDRCIAQNFTSDTKDCLFINLGGYYVSYGTDHNGDAWQRHATRQFQFQLNGKDAIRINNGTSYVANGAGANVGSDKAFWYWDAANTTGLYPTSDYITDENKYNPLFSFTMPQNDVNLTAVYADRVQKAVVSMDKPVAGKELPTSASIERDGSGIGADSSMTVALTWYEVKTDGSKVAAAGKARAGAEYVATFTAPQSKDLGYFYSQEITADNVTVRTNDGDAKAAEASVNASTGALSVTTTSFKTAGFATTEPASNAVTIELKNGGLAAAAGRVVEDETPSVGAGATGESGTKPIDAVQVSYTEDSDTVTVAAPVCEGYNFCYWSDVPDGVKADSVVGTATFNVADIKSALKLDAVYAPVVTEIDLGMAAPVAGKKLATSITSINVKGTGDTELDLLGLFTDAGSLPVSWSSNASGKAACSTAYAATAALDEDGDKYLDVDKVISPNVVVKANGVELPGANAGFAIADGKLALCAAFPATASKTTANKAAAKAVTGKTVNVKAGKNGKTAKAKTVAIKAAASASGAKAGFKVVSAAKQLKVNAKTGKVTLKKGAKKGKTYTAKLKVSYGKASKAVKVKFVVK